MPAIIDLSSAYHSGIVVRDIDVALAEYARVSDTAWTPVTIRELTLRDEHRQFDVTLKIAYTREGPHRLELLQEVPGTIWELGDTDHRPHHLGYWSADLEAQSAALSRAGAPLLATYGADPVRVTGIAYHRLPNGALVELVDETLRPGFEAWWAGGPLHVPYRAPRD